MSTTDRTGFIVRILHSGADATAGMGFVVGDRQIVTCAHVVNAALGRDTRAQDAPSPDVRILIDFPLLSDSEVTPRRSCRVDAWAPPPLAGLSAGDVAGLVLVNEDLPLGAGPARLTDPTTMQGVTADIFGFPGDPPRPDSGAWVRLRLRGPVGGGFIQLDTDSESIIRVQPGYTGSPVILTDGSGNIVIAMLAATSSSEQVADAYAIPVSRLADVWSFLGDERSTLRRIVRTAINSAVDQVIDIGDRNAVRELLLSASADIGDMRAADVNDLPQMFLERLGPALTVLDEQGYKIQRARLRDALFQHIVAGIQANVVGDGHPGSAEERPKSERPIGENEPIEQVEWLPDAPTKLDLLGRRVLAQVLATRLRRFTDDEPGTSFLIHIDGPWGAGKSTLLGLLGTELQEEPKWLPIDFNAWRQSRIGASWWSLLIALRRDIGLSRRLPARTSLRFAEWWMFFRRAGALFALAFIILMVAAAAVFVLLKPGELTLRSSVSIAQGTTAILAALGTLWAGALVASKFLLWDSARGARLFEQSDSSPMQSVADHFSWLLKKAKRPVVFFIDDLDRCTNDYVVELLEAVQTLIRDAVKGLAARSTKESCTVHFVVASDGAWIRKSYEIAFEQFSASVGETGRPLGYLFLDKLFQLRVPVPTLDPVRQQDYLKRLLRTESGDYISTKTSIEERAVRKKIQESSTEAAIVETLREASPRVRRSVAATAVEKLAEPATIETTEHALQRFGPLLEPNPRAIKRFINDYSILRAVRTLEGIPVGMGPLALWTAIETRWPELADFLRKKPESIDLINSSLDELEVIPPDLRDLFRDPRVQEIVTFKDAGPLTSELIRACCGSVAPILHTSAQNNSSLN